MLAWGVRSEASSVSITFAFDCTIVNVAPPNTCTPGGDWGRLTLTDSLVDTNRVDVDITITPLPGATGIARFYLNYDNSVTVGGATNRTFGMVAQNAPAGDHTPAGTVDLNFNTLGPFQTQLDLRMDPSLNPGLEFHGSLVVYSTLSGHAESDLAFGMFVGLDSSNLYAAYDTLPDNQSQQYGARSIVETQAVAIATPEPATLTLVGMSLLGLGARARRRR
jgi:hypothetical protein